MKKLALLFGLIIATSGVSMAILNEGQSSDIDTLKKQGFSTSTLEIVDKAKYLNQGSGDSYVRYFTHKKHSKKGNAYQQVKTYFDPIQDDGKFLEHSIEFSNTWQGDDTKYSSGLIKNEDL